MAEEANVQQSPATVPSRNQAPDAAGPMPSAPSHLPPFARPRRRSLSLSGLEYRIGHYVTMLDSSSLSPRSAASMADQSQTCQSLKSRPAGCPYAAIEERYVRSCDNLLISQWDRLHGPCGL